MRFFKSGIKAACAISLLLPLSGCGILYTTTLMGLCVFQSDLTITPETLPRAIVGQPYHAEILVSNGNTPVYQISLTGDLPAGLEFTFNKDEPINNEATIQGIATESGSFPVHIYASAYGTQCTGQSGNRQYEIMSVSE